MATFLGILSSISALVPLILKLVGLFVKTPKPAREQLLEGLLKYVTEIHDAVEAAKDSKGDTSAIERAVNSRRK
jgi:hypothetical protein